MAALADAGGSLDDVDRLAVVSGSSFTGVRIGMATPGLALTRGWPVIAVPARRDCGVERSVGDLVS
jgi:tRNA A37 threonylcarbamoyladenosine modification protein TsaB